MSLRARWLFALFLLLVEPAIAADVSKRKPLTMAEVLAASQTAVPCTDSPLLFHRAGSRLCERVIVV